MPPLDIFKTIDPNVSRETLTRAPIGQVLDNPWQNRTHYGDLEELAADIERNGLLQPPIARLAPDGSDTYQIAFGHRRLRACQLAGLVFFPFFVHILTDEEMAEYAWSENEKRSDTSPIEKARHIQRVQTDFGWTQEQVGVRFGINRSTAANLLRLLELPAAVMTLVDSGTLPQRSGMLLLRLTDAPDALAAVATAAATGGQTTREIEAAIAAQRLRIEKERQVAAVDALGLIDLLEAQREISGEDTQRQAQQAEREQAATAERERLQAIAEKLLDGIVQRFPVDEMWGDLRFWRFVAAGESSYNIAPILSKALHLADAYRRLLEAAIFEQKWSKKHGKVIDLSATENNRRRLYSALGQPTYGETTNWEPPPSVNQNPTGKPAGETADEHHDYCTGMDILTPDCIAVG